VAVSPGSLDHYTTIQRPCPRVARSHEDADRRVACRQQGMAFGAGRCAHPRTTGRLDAACAFARPPALPGLPTRPRGTLGHRVSALRPSAPSRCPSPPAPCADARRACGGYDGCATAGRRRRVRHRQSARWLAALDRPCRRSAPVEWLRRGPDARQAGVSLPMAGGRRARPLEQAHGHCSRRSRECVHRRHGQQPRAAVRSVGAIRSDHWRR